MQQTNTISPSFPAAGLLRAIAAPFRAVGIFLVQLAESGPKMDQIRRLNATSDEDLAARGLTREGEVRRIFGGMIY